MTERITGLFDVTMNKQPMHAAAEQSGIGRMSLDKRYHGDLDATGVGEMLAAMTATRGSAGYVALERVEGTLRGRRGTFFLQHAGTMDRGTPSLSVTVVPDSGTDELIGLSGRLDIRIDGRRAPLRLRVRARRTVDDDGVASRSVIARPTHRSRRERRAAARPRRREGVRDRRDLVEPGAGRALAPATPRSMSGRHARASDRGTA